VKNVNGVLNSALKIDNIKTQSDAVEDHCRTTSLFLDTLNLNESAKEQIGT
jgi:hypothetical protein